jgi:hypothetical protein
MRPEPTPRIQFPSRGHYRAPRGAYLFFCVAVALTVALLICASLLLPARVVQGAATQEVGHPVATIQFTPDRQGLCRQLLFHNDTGRFEHAGTGTCRNQIPEQLLVETVRGRRAEALARVFKFR